MIKMNKYKNVTGYAFDKKYIGGKRTDIDAHVFYVEKKSSDIAPDDRIPSMIDGKPTDVVEIGIMRSLLLPPVGTSVRSQALKPLRGGIQIGCEANNSVGTLGAIVKSKTGKLVGMTNGHVANNPMWNAVKTPNNIVGSAVGYKIFQPNNRGNLVGSVVQDKPADLDHDNLYDVSFFDIDPKLGVTTGIMGLTKKPQALINIFSVSSEIPVYKSGRTTGVTVGHIVAHNCKQDVVSTTGGFIHYTEQALIKGASLTEIMADHGDSGSVVCVDIGNGFFGIIGILMAGSQNSAGESYAVICPINNIARDFGISSWDGSIVLSSNTGLYAATGGSLYSDAGITFLGETNEFVCAYGDAREILESGCLDGNLTIRDSAIELISYSQPFRKRDIELKTVVLFSYAAMDVAVAVRVETKAKTGVRLSANITSVVTTESSVSVEMAVRNNINLGFDISTSTVNSLALGANAITNSKVFVGVDCLTYLSTGEVSIGFANAVFIVMATTLSLSGVGQTATAAIDLGLNVYTGTAISQIGGLVFGDPVLAVAACDGGNCDDLSYGGML